MPKRILVCDNEDVLRSLVRAALDEGSYEFLEARDGIEALTSARAEHPDLILLDVSMPGCDGLAVLAELRADLELRTTHVVVLTAHSRAADREEALLAGADRFVTKPFSPVELAAVVEELLQPA